MFVDDDATQLQVSVEQQNATIARIRYKYVAVRVTGEKRNPIDGSQTQTGELMQHLTASVDFSDLVLAQLTVVMKDDKCSSW